MKTTVWALIALVAGYIAYRNWFASSAEEPGTKAPDLAVPEVEAPPVAETAPDEPAARPALDLDVEGGAPPPPPRDEKAWELDAERRRALAAGDEAKAREIADTLLREHAASDPARWVQVDLGREHLKRYAQLGRNAEGLQHAREAWRRLTPALFRKDAREEERKQLRATLRQLSDMLLFGGRHIDGVDEPYAVRRGDNLSTLCDKVFPQRGSKVAPGLIVEVNQLGDARNLRAEETIRVPLGEPEIVVVKSEYRLYFLQNGCYVRDWPVGLGKEGSTPEAQFRVVEKIKNPDWNPRAGVTIPYGHPENILGTRWMAFNNSAQYTGFGIHGTTEPTSIGKDASSGCVRMLRADVEQLFEWTPRGTAVRILR